MSAPLADQEYFIVSFVDPNPSVGADNIDDCAVKPVITDGAMRTWSIKGVDGVSQLVLNDNWYASNNRDQVVVQTSVDPGTRWVVLRVTHNGDALYQIILDGTSEAWTATAVDPKEPVVLRPLVDPPKNPNQLWKLVPLLQD